MYENINHWRYSHIFHVDYQQNKILNPGQVRAGLVHKGFRTIIYKDTQKSGFWTGLP